MMVLAHYWNVSPCGPDMDSYFSIWPSTVSQIQSVFVKFLASSDGSNIIATKNASEL